MYKATKAASVNNSSTFRVTTLFGQTVGVVSLLLGFTFFLLGLSGSVDLILESDRLNARLLNGSPGVVLILVGFLILWRYKPKESRIITRETTVQRVPSKASGPGMLGQNKHLPALEQMAPGITACLDDPLFRELMRETLRLRPDLTGAFETHRTTTTQSVDKSMLSR